MLIGAQSDSALAAAVVQHPNGRSNTAILAVLAGQYAFARPSALASVHASDRVRRLVAALFERTLADSGRQVLDDREAETNQNVLLVLANCCVSQEIAWAATRRLPEGALKRFELDYVPQR
jgi:hypothetical protein